MPLPEKYLGCMFSAHEIADRLGRAHIARRLGIHRKNITVALGDLGRFRPAWFPTIRDMCAEKGIDCPESAFNFREAEQQP